jgi:hypothetical protein
MKWGIDQSYAVRTFGNVLGREGEGECIQSLQFDLLVYLFIYYFMM